MQAGVGDRLLIPDGIVGLHDRAAEILEVLGEEGAPPYRVRYDDGHETVLVPGLDAVVQRFPTGE